LTTLWDKRLRLQDLGRAERRRFEKVEVVVGGAKLERRCSVYDGVERESGLDCLGESSSRRDVPYNEEVEFAACVLMTLVGFGLGVYDAADAEVLARAVASNS
jgi:hypothetical protein